MSVHVGQILRQAARLAPDAVALVDLGNPGDARRAWTFAELERRARCVAAQLEQHGVEPGDRVGLVAENQAEVAAVWFGIVYAGAIVVPLHVLSAPGELAERMAHAGIALVVHDQARSELVAQALAAERGATRALALPACDFAREGSLDYPRAAAASDTAMILYSSGTTGKPKGAAISHASLLLHTLLLSSHALGLDSESRVLCTLPLSHSYGCRLAMLAPLYARARIVVMPRFDAERALSAVRAEGVTWLPAVPTMFAAFGKLPGGQAPASLRWALCAGAPLGAEVLRRAEAVLGVEVRQGYGMTEATFATMNAPPDARVIGSVGKPIWGVELRIVDEQERDLPRGSAGQVLVRGHNVMTQYWSDPDATREVLTDGWVRSGDVGVLDTEGRLSIVDRIKDLIIRGGYNVYPSEVENALGRHPDVHDVAVLGRADDFYGEEVVAVVVPREGSQLTVRSLDEFARQHLSRTKIPREYVLATELPLGATGKVHKRTLRAALSAGKLVVHKTSGS